MEWNQRKCLNLIDGYERSPELWNTKHGQYYNKRRKNDAWIMIANKVGCTPEEAKRKMDSLQASFRREKAKVNKTTGTDEVYVSRWFAFSRMAFLLDRDEPIDSVDKDEPRTTTDSVEEAYTEPVITMYEAELMQIPSPLPEELAETSKRKRKATVTTSVSLMRKQKRHYLSDYDAKFDEALGILKNSVANNVTSDACGVYGQHVAFKLRSYTRTTRNIVEHHINNILFKADMGHYSSTVTTPVQHQNIPQSPSSDASHAPSVHTPVPTPSPQHQTALASTNSHEYNNLDNSEEIHVKFDDFDKW
uniref:Uncharacterized protein LOC114333942 isoform X2 n=1 Tax=Diabrotica virgifera virgifera TaxID=50390 RepID=A0A6P7FTV7_DIAVI